MVHSGWWPAETEPRACSTHTFCRVAPTSCLLHGLKTHVLAKKSALQCVPLMGNRHFCQNTSAHVSKDTVFTTVLLARTSRFTLESSPVVDDRCRSRSGVHGFAPSTRFPALFQLIPTPSLTGV
jgi:hypothetical protein